MGPIMYHGIAQTAEFLPMSLELTDEAREEASASLRQYLRDEFDIDAGSLAAGHLLDHIVADIGPSIYNAGVRAVQEHLHARIAEVDLELNESEFPLSRRHRIL